MDLPAVYEGLVVHSFNGTPPCEEPWQICLGPHLKLYSGIVNGGREDNRTLKPGGTQWAGT
jgi:hypothetical protein